MERIINGENTGCMPEKTGNTENNITNMTYEVAIAELETILDKMDKGELPLDDSMKNFERGMKLIAHCEGILTSYEKKITKILEDKNGGLNEIEIEI